jgi:hypothetical protein
VEREFTRLATEALATAYRRAGGIAKLARQTNGAAVIRNIAVLELTPIAVNLAARIAPTDTEAASELPAIPDHFFWQVGHDGEGPDPSLFKARVFDPMTMQRPSEARAATAADALRAALKGPTHG